LSGVQVQANPIYPSEGPLKGASSLFKHLPHGPSKPCASMGQIVGVPYS